MRLVRTVTVYRTVATVTARGGPSGPSQWPRFISDHARRLRLEKLLYLELSRIPNGFLTTSNGGFISEMDKNLTALYSTDISQRTQVPVRVKQPYNML